jgi:hypothetical protein
VDVGRSAEVGFADQDFALKFRDWARSFIVAELAKERPGERYATVVSVNRVTRKATVQFNGETANTVVNLGSIQPAWIGQRVRIKGTKGDRYIDDILGSTISADDTDLAYWQYSTLTSMASPGNGFLRLNNATVASVTAFAIAHTDSSGSTVSRVIGLMNLATTQYSFVSISKANDPSIYVVYKVTARTDNTTWSQLTCIFMASAGTLSNNDYVRVRVSPSIP